MDIWGYIQAVLSLVVRQGRLVVVTGMLVGLGYIMVTAARSLLGENQSESVDGFLWIVGLFCVVVIPFVILVIVGAENVRRGEELRYGVGNRDDD